MGRYAVKAAVAMSAATLAATFVSVAPASALSQADCAALQAQAQRLQNDIELKTFIIGDIAPFLDVESTSISAHDPVSQLIKNLQLDIRDDRRELQRVQRQLRGCSSSSSPSAGGV